MVHLYSIDEQMIQSEIGYMINPSLHINKVFREQVEKCLRATFHPNTMEIIRNFTRKKDTCIIAIIIFYESKTKNQ